MKAEEKQGNPEVAGQRSLIKELRGRNLKADGGM